MDSFQRLLSHISKAGKRLTAFFDKSFDTENDYTINGPVKHTGPTVAQLEVFFSSDYL